MTAHIDAMLNDLLVREGGYVNNPNDTGGETNWGITVAVARASGYMGPMKDLPRAKALDIYKDRYWRIPKFDIVATHSIKIAEELFDTGVNMGPAVAATFLQRCLNAFNRQSKLYPDIAVDGQIGPATLRALDSYLTARRPDGEDTMMKALNCLQGAKYIALAEGRPKNEEFAYGWIRTRIAL